MRQGLDRAEGGGATDDEDDYEDLMDQQENYGGLQQQQMRQYGQMPHGPYQGDTTNKMYMPNPNSPDVRAKKQALKNQREAMAAIDQTQQMLYGYKPSSAMALANSLPQGTHVQL